MVKNLINFFITISFLLPQSLGFTIGLLQLLQLEPHTTNTGFIKPLISKLNLESIPKMSELWQSVDSAD